LCDYVNHLRFVHNAQTIVSSTVLYLVISSWSLAPELISDLKQFLGLSQKSRAAAEVPELLDDLIPQVGMSHVEFSAKLSSTIRHVVRTATPFRSRPLTSPPEESAPVGTQWRDLKNQKWMVETLGKPEDSLSEIQVWLDKWKRCLPSLERELRDPRRALLRRGRRPSSVDVRRLTAPQIRVSVADWPAGANSVQAVTEIEVYVPDWRSSIHACRGFTPKDADPENFSHDYEWSLTRVRRTFGPHRFGIQARNFSLPAETFDSFPTLRKELNSIADLSPADALAWAEDKKVAGIRGRTPRFFGATIRGEHLGYVGPLLIVALHLYLLIMLHSLSGHSPREGTTVHTPLPWAATIKQPLPILFSFVTLALLPTVAIAVSMYRLTSINWYFAVVASIPMLAVGIWIFVLAPKLGQCANATSDNNAQS